MSYKELRKMTKDDDVILVRVREVMIRGGASERSMYVRLSGCDANNVRIWRGLNGGIWLTLNFGCTNSHSVFLTRGYTTFVTEVESYD